MADSVNWKFHTTVETAWKAMLDSISKAQKTIDFEQYLFGGDGAIEREFADALIRKAKEGVKVRLLFDAVGSFFFYYSPLPKLLRDAGVVILYHQVTLPPIIKRLVPVILRDHRKLLVIDEEVAHIGGVVIKEDFRSWRDTNVELEGPIVEDLLVLFNQAWDRSKKWKPLGRAQIGDSTKDEFAAIGNSYHLKDKQLYKAILQAISFAKESVQITTPYFAPGDKFLKAIYRAAKRGVKVEILLPYKSDNIFADYIAKWHYKELLRHGVKLYLYRETVLHQKTITVDDSWASIGSSNFDWVSFWWNYELNITSSNKDFIAELKSHFAEDLKKSEEVIYKKRKWFWMK